MTLVPEGDRLVAEVWVSNQDVGFVRPGQDAKLKLVTFQFQKYGMIEGRVLRVNADATEAPSPNTRSDTLSRDRPMGPLAFRALVDLASQQSLRRRASATRCSPACRWRARSTSARAPSSSTCCRRCRRRFTKPRASADRVSVAWRHGFSRAGAPALPHDGAHPRLRERGRGGFARQRRRLRREPRAVATSAARCTCRPGRRRSPPGSASTSAGRLRNLDAPRPRPHARQGRVDGRA